MTPPLNVVQNSPLPPQIKSHHQTLTNVQSLQYGENPTIFIPLIIQTPATGALYEFTCTLLLWSYNFVPL